MERPRRICVFGIQGFDMRSTDEQIECFNWRDANKVRNVRDYDCLVFSALSPMMATEGDWRVFDSKFTFDAVFDVLSNHGTVVVVGDARKRIEIQADSNASPRLRETDFLRRWSGFAFTWDSTGGTAIDFTDSSDLKRMFGNYLRHLQEWSVALSDIEFTTDHASHLERYVPKESSAEPDVEVVPFCETRYKLPVAFAVTAIVASHTGPRLRRGRIYSGDTIHHRQGSIIFLPKIKIPEGDALALVFADVMGVELSRPEPEWLQALEAPGQRPLDDQISTVVQELASLGDRHEELLDQRANARTVLQLLYEQHHSLEVAVWDALESLGATVHRPADKHSDGWFEFTVDGAVHSAVLEVKSTRKGQHSKDGMRQLLEWKARATTDHDRKFLTVFIGNNDVELPLEDRSDPFADEWRKSATFLDVCALTTVQVFRVLQACYEQVTSPDSFWRIVRDTIGVLDDARLVSAWCVSDTTEPDESTTSPAIDA